ncbi:hypothetical protein [Rhodopirellula bahusiensis]|uniref:hypothetical protein n=1 Tax=Rhodopirellula bahusiensis TaxID=2014065 RepID=UPI00326378C9
MVTGSIGGKPLASVYVKVEEIDPPVYVLPPDIAGTWRVSEFGWMRSAGKFGIPIESAKSTAEELLGFGWQLEITQAEVVANIEGGAAARTNRLCVIAPWMNGDVAYVLTGSVDPTLPIAIVRRDEFTIDVLKKWQGQDAWVRLVRVGK